MDRIGVASQTNKFYLLVSTSGLSLFYPKDLVLYDIPRVLWQNCKHHLFEFLAVAGLNHVRVPVNARENLKFSKEIANFKKKQAIEKRFN